MGRIAVPFFMGEPMPFRGRVTGARELAPELPHASPQVRMGVLYRDLARLVEREGAPVVVSGDCMVAIGVLAGLQARDIDPTLLWFDAHGDFHTWETTTSGFLGGMPLAMVTGRGEQTVVEAAGMTPLPDKRIVLVDARDLDPGEDEAVASSGMRVVAVNEVRDLDLSGPLYVHVDVDVVDPGELPGVNYPVAGGPPLAEMRSAMEHLAATGQVVAFSLSSWNPDLAGAERGAVASLSLAEVFEA
jgi:arginase